MGGHRQGHDRDPLLPSLPSQRPRRPQRPRRRRRRDLDRLGWYELRRRPITTTTRQAEALNLALVEHPTELHGWFLGLDIANDQPVYSDPFALYAAGIVQSPNAVVVGDVGMGKSSLIKTNYVLRPLSFGHHVAVFDRKAQGGVGEYARVAEIMGVAPIRFSRTGGGTIINPLDPRIVARAAGDTVGQDTLLRMLAELAHGGTLDSRAGWALTAAHRHAVTQATTAGREAILGDVVAALLSPDPSMAPVDGVTVDELRAWGLNVALDLDRLCRGDLAGLVDGPTSPELDLAAPLLVFDISDVDDDGPALPILMAIANTFLGQAWARPDGIRRLLIQEEGYHLVAYDSTARVMRRNLKQGRGRGLGVVTAIHHLSDIPSTSEGIAAIKEASILHLFRQAKRTDAVDCVGVFGLPELSADLLGDLAQGCHLYQAGRQPPRVVTHLRSALETWATDTDAAMLGAAADPEPPALTGTHPAVSNANLGSDAGRPA